MVSLVCGCAGLPGEILPTPLPAEYMPTAVALTLEARGINQTPVAKASSTPVLSPEATATFHTDPATATSPAPSITPTEADTPFSTSTITVTVAQSLEPLAAATETPTLEIPEATWTPELVLEPPTPAGTATNTPAPPFPDAPVQIYRLGELSRLISPIDVTVRLTTGTGKVARIELYGEDGRLLARYLRTFRTIPWEVAKIGVSLEFEIHAVAEEGRLVVSVEDSFGRLVGVNSVNLILLSTGMNEVKPATALWQRLIIQEPAPKTLIQGGKLIVSGRALLNDPAQQLRVMLIGEDGRILGQRLARVDVIIPGDYGTYLAEVPYLISDMTPALLVVYEEGEPVSDIAHLSSVPVLLTP